MDGVPLSIEQFSITPTGSNRSVSMPIADVAFLIRRLDTNEVIRDFTGANAVQFPNFMGGLTTTQKRELLTQIVQWIIEIKALEA